MNKQWLHDAIVFTESLPLTHSLTHLLCSLIYSAHSSTLLTHLLCSLNYSAHSTTLLTKLLTHLIHVPMLDTSPVFYWGREAPLPPYSRSDCIPWRRSSLVGTRAARRCHHSLLGESIAHMWANCALCCCLSISGSALLLLSPQCPLLSLPQYMSHISYLMT